MLTLIKIGIKKVLVYKSLILIMILKNFIYIFLQYSLWLAIKKNSTLDVNITNILIYFLVIRGISSINFNLSQSISYDVKYGEIINVLTKPISIHKYYFFDILGNTISKVLTILSLNLLFVLFLLKSFNISYIIQLLLLILGAYILNFVIELIFGTISFFTQSIWGIESLKSIFILILSGSFFPLYMYPEWFSKVAKYTPFSYVYGRVADFAINGLGFFEIFNFQIIFSLLLFLVYKQILKICLRKISINGG